MSKLYRTLESDKGTSTRAANVYIKACAQSWDGSIIVQLNSDGTFTVGIGRGSTTSTSKIIFSSHIDDEMEKLK